jgi:hypothetical protein
MTAQEAGERMTTAELVEWAAYEAVYGPIVVHERIDLAGALIGTLVARLGGDKRTQPKDLVPKWDQRPRSIEEAWGAFELLAKKKKD